MTLTPLLAIHGVWAAWATSWIAASAWHGRTQRREGGRRAFPPMALAALGLCGLFAEPLGSLHPLWRLPPAAGWATVAPAAAGAGFGWWARVHLGAPWSGGVARREAHRVVESGPYGVVRHPIYGGVILAAAALGLVKATPLALGGTVLVAAAFAWKTRVEERFLAAELGEQAYAAYRARVPMLVPRR